MGRVFNTTGVCIPEKHYMVDINGRLQQIKVLVDGGKYFTINRARQYGKTTTLRALAEMLRDEYYVVLLDFQTFDNEKFSAELPALDLSCRYKRAGTKEITGYYQSDAKS